MTVNELINKLNSVEDKSIMVLTRGYEGGLRRCGFKIE